MGTSSFKSKVHKYARMQSFILGKISGFRIFKSSKKALEFAQPAVKMRFEKKRTGGIYQFAVIAIAALIFSSCQKEVNNPAPAPSADVTSIESTDTSAATASLKTMYWTVGGVQRQATVYIPSTTGYHPIVFGFHGAGGSGAALTTEKRVRRCAGSASSRSRRTGAPIRASLTGTRVMIAGSQIWMRAPRLRS